MYVYGVDEADFKLLVLKTKTSRYATSGQCSEPGKVFFSRVVKNLNDTQGVCYVLYMQLGYPSALLLQER